MKKVLFAVAILACAACSSKPKQNDATVSSDVEQKVLEATAETTAPAPAPVEDKKSKKKAVTAEPTTDSGGGFPAITGTEKSSASCSVKSDSRKITVLNVTEGGCGVVYNKMGEDKTVAIAKADMNYCDTVANKIKSNLESAGFDCGGGSSNAAPAPEEKGTSSDQKTQ